MDEEFENIILDEEDNLNGLESLREKTNNKDKNINDIKLSDKNIIQNNDDNNKPKKESEEKEISEEYNDFDYNIEENKENQIMNENNDNNFLELNSREDNKINDLKNNQENYLDNNLEKEEKKDNSNEIEEQLTEEKEKEENIENMENNTVNIIQNIENNYNSLKNELEFILTKVEFNDMKEIIEQNDQLMQYISKFDEIMNSIIEVFPRGEKLLTEKISKIRKLEKKRTREEKEKKILDIYKNEYIDLEKKYKLIKDPIYKQSLLNNLTKLKKEYEIITEENKKLKQEQKLNEINIEKKSKNAQKEEKDVKRMEKDIKNIKSQINLLKNKVNKNKINIIENNKRINKFVEKEKNLDFIAKEKYGIKEYQDVNLDRNNTIKRIKEKKNSLKKIEIYEKGIETNKNKYERQIKNNEMIITELKNEKNKLLFYYKELIGEEEFRRIIENFKEEEKNKNQIEEMNMEDKYENLNKDIQDIISNKDDYLILKNNENISEKNEKKIPEFLDFFKQDEEEGNNDINKENINNTGNENNNSEVKEEKEINIEKFEEINSMSNRNKQSEDEPPPNEYEDLEEFQI